MVKRYDRIATAIDECLDENLIRRILNARPNMPQHSNLLRPSQKAIQERERPGFRHGSRGPAFRPQQHVLVLKHRRHGDQRHERALGHATQKQSGRAAHTPKPAPDHISVQYELHMTDDMTLCGR